MYILQINLSRILSLTCFINDVFTFDFFSVYIGPKISKQFTFKMQYFCNRVAVGVVYAGLPAVSVANGMLELKGLMKTAQK